MKHCPVCKIEIYGRPDKIYCSLKCKSIDHYEKRNKSEAFYFQVDKQLKTNRKVLKRFNHKGFSTVRKTDLIDAGFNPNFFTHYWKNQKGQVYLFCYDYGFLAINKDNKDKYLVVEWQDYMRKLHHR